jgi:flavin reductase (DIM6/NTAB) family NADH-FMN oxidoreductase RutF
VSPEPLVDLAEQFRLAFRRHATTVTLVSYFDSAGTANAMTATAVIPLSVQPPSVVVSVNRQSRSRDEIVSGGMFGVGFLQPTQQDLASRLSRPGSPKALGSREFVAEPSRPTPAIVGSLAHLDCSLANVHDEHTHSLLVGNVTGIVMGPRGVPLLYADGAYVTVDPGSEAQYEQLWERVMAAFL